MSFDLQLDTLTSGYDGHTFWCQARAGVIPPHTAVVTLQKARQGGSDVFFAIHDFRSEDLGETWSGPVKHDTLDRREAGNGLVSCPCDGTPAWHAATGKLLLTGHLAFYRGDSLAHEIYPRRVFYSTYNAATRAWADWLTVQTPHDDNRFYNAGSGCGQRVDLPNGEILLPVYFTPKDMPADWSHRFYSATVMRCSFDGETMTYLEHGTELNVKDPRGCCEPSLTTFGGRYFLTVRNDIRGYVTRGEDGLHFAELQPWTFDDGEELGNYNTQQHWITHSDALYLVYTRLGANNDHVFRHRGPLFIGQVDPERLCIIRDTERIVVPERGARLGNFGTVNVSPQESWVVVTEWMQGPGPDPYDTRAMETRGADNSVFISRLKWHQANRLVAAQ